MGDREAIRIVVEELGRVRAVEDPRMLALVQLVRALCELRRLERNERTIEFRPAGVQDSSKFVARLTCPARVPTIIGPGIAGPDYWQHDRSEPQTLGFTLGPARNDRIPPVVTTRDFEVRWPDATDRITAGFRLRLEKYTGPADPSCAYSWTHRQVGHGRIGFCTTWRGRWQPVALAKPGVLGRRGRARMEIPAASGDGYYRLAVAAVGPAPASAPGAFSPWSYFNYYSRSRPGAVTLVSPAPGAVYRETFLLGDLRFQARPVAEGVYFYEIRVYAANDPNRNFYTKLLEGPDDPIYPAYGGTRIVSDRGGWALTGPADWVAEVTAITARGRTSGRVTFLYIP